MLNIQLGQLSRLTFMLLLLVGFTFLTPQTGYAQGGRPQPKDINLPLGGNNNPVKSAPCRLAVNITGSPSIVRLGETRIFVAGASCGTAPYKFQWSGTNIATGGGRASSVLNKSSIRVRFSQVATFRVRVYVIDENKKVASHSVWVRVLR